MNTTTNTPTPTIALQPKPIEQMNGDEFISYLDSRIAALFAEVERSDMWQTLTSVETEPALVQCIMRELYLEIFAYNPPIVEAALAIIGQMPRSLEVRKIKAMVRHLAEEFDHGEMGLRDYVALGGDEQEARSARISPASFAAAGVWWMMAKVRDPFAYLGAMYLFETLTPIVSEKIMPFLARKGLGKDALGFVEFHSKEDPKHAALMKELIQRIIEQFPAAKESMSYGLDCFVAVYPLPVWNAAHQRAVSRKTHPTRMAAAAV